MRWFLSLLATLCAFLAPAVARAVEPTRLVLTRAPAAARKCVMLGVTTVNDPPVAYGDERTFEDSLLRVPRWG